MGSGVRQALRGNAASFLPVVSKRIEFVNADYDRVAQWRAMRASWDSIAANLGCSVDKVRRTFDPGYRPLHLVPETDDAASAATKFFPLNPTVRPDTLQMAVLQLLGRQTYSFSEIAALLAGSAVDQILPVLAKKGLIERNGAICAITDLGRAELARHAGMQPVGPSVFMQVLRDKVLLALADGCSTTTEINRRLETTKVDRALRALQLEGLAHAREQERTQDKMGRLAFVWSLTAKGLAAAATLRGASHD